MLELRNLTLEVRNLMLEVRHLIAEVRNLPRGIADFMVEVRNLANHVPNLTRQVCDIVTGLPDLTSCYGWRFDITRGVNMAIDRNYIDLVTGQAGLANRLHVTRSRWLLG